MQLHFHGLPASISMHNNCCMKRMPHVFAVGEPNRLTPVFARRCRCSCGPGHSFGREVTRENSMEAELHRISVALPKSRYAKDGQNCCGTGRDVVTSSRWYGWKLPDDTFPTMPLNIVSLLDPAWTVNAHIVQILCPDMTPSINLFMLYHSYGRNWKSFHRLQQRRWRVHS